MLLLRDRFPADPALDLALSRAVLTQVAAGERPPTLRLYRPGPTVAFGRRDALAPGFPTAVAAARDHGFVPVVRPAGGHAAAYDERSLICEELRPTPRGDTGLDARFDASAAWIADALRGLGVDARIGELPGEYCAGAHSISVGGRVKVVGIAQRVVAGAALVTGVVVVGGSAALRAVLTEVYRALERPMDPATVGALQDAAPDLTVAAVDAALLAAVSPGDPPREAPLDAPTLSLARDLVAAALA